MEYHYDEVNETFYVDIETAGLKDVTESDPYVEGYEKWKKDMKDLHDIYAAPALDFIPFTVTLGDHGGCTHPNKYKNVISNSLKFWSCPDCGADLGDINEC